MKWTVQGSIALGRFVLLVMVAATSLARAQEAKTPYPSMAPLDQYLMERNAEIALVRSAAPESVSRDAEIIILGRQGYETAVQGKNGWVCLVQRSWSAGIDDPDFWNPKLRAPICFNPPAARFSVPITIKRTEWALSTRSKAQMFENLQGAFDRKELPTLESGAMCYMMSKLGYLSDRDGHWYPHLMFFTPLMAPAAWGSGLPGSPVAIGVKDVEDGVSVFLVPVGRWSDGTAGPVYEH